MITDDPKTWVLRCRYCGRKIPGPLTWVQKTGPYRGRRRAYAMICRWDCRRRNR